MKIKCFISVLSLSISIFGTISATSTSGIKEKNFDSSYKNQIELFYEILSNVQKDASTINSYISLNNIEANNSNYSDANMINYNLSTKTISYENFDENSYQNRNNSTSTSLMSSSLSAKNNDNIYSNEIMTSDSFVPSDIEYTISPNSLIGTDERTQVLQTRNWPYCGIVKMYMTFKNVKNQVTNVYTDRTFVGTGFMEGPNLMVTAGHCGYSDVTSGYQYEDSIANPRFPDTIEVYAGINGYKERSSSYIYYANVSVINIQKEYFEHHKTEYDWCAMELDRDLGRQTGYYGKISNWYKASDSVYSYGYPGDKATDTMWETHGNLTGKSTYQYKYNFDTYGGQSGSPVFMTAADGSTYVCGIHTSGSANANYATRINSFIFSYLNSYVTNHNYEHLAATITPSNYGFADAYPTSETTKTHTLSTGFEFSTTRYRTGFIQGEYIVMSPFRKDITEAYIEYDFNVPVTKIEVDLTHWRTLPIEWTYPSNCTAVLRTDSGIVRDLLSSEMNLPTDRTKPTTYSIIFDNPVYTFEFYMESKNANFNDNNRGRLCIGDMKVYTTEGWY